MLVRNLFNELESEDVVAAQLVSTQVEADDMLRMIGASFCLPHENLSKAALLRNLEAFLRARNAEGKRVLLVVDEAQNLPRKSIEELRMLSNYQEGGQALLQSFLLGQSELKSTLQGPGMEQVRQRIIAGYHLRPLDREELEAYIEHRLSLVGWSQDPGITAGAYDAIHTAAQGIPRRVNTMTDRLLLFGALEELHQIDVQHVATVVEEISQEVGHSNASMSDEEILVNEPAGDLNDRIDVLEKQLAQLRNQVRKDHKLLKKAILLQMDLDDDSDI